MGLAEVIVKKVLFKNSFCKNAMLATIFEKNAQCFTPVFHSFLLLYFQKVYIFLANKTIIIFAYFCTGGITVQQR